MYWLNGLLKHTFFLISAINLVLYLTPISWDQNNSNMEKVNFKNINEKVLDWMSFKYFLQIHEKSANILEQLERLRSEDTPHHLMITHSIESYWIPSQKKIKSKLQI